MDRLDIGVAGVVAALVLIGIRVPVGVVLGLVSFTGIAAILNVKAAWGILTAVPYSFITNWSLSAVPMFLLMGFVASQAGLTRGLFASMRMFIGHIPGGLASATVVASALWHFEPTLAAALDAVAAGSFTAADYGVYSYMKEGGCSLAPLGTFEGKVPEAAMKLVAEREAAIRSGAFTVEINDEEPKAR